MPPGFFFSPAFFSGADFETVSIFEICTGFVSGLENKPVQCRSTGLFSRPETNLVPISKIPTVSKSAPEKKAGEKKILGAKMGKKFFFWNQPKTMGE